MIRHPGLGALPRRIGRDRTGGALVEFALLAPVFIAMMIGVMQVGVYMQNYSAVRSLSADAARLAAVEYQKGPKSHPPGPEQLEDIIEGMAVGSPYNLRPDSLEVNIDQVTSPVDGARKFDMDISYSTPSFMSGIGFSDITFEYSRPLFVIDNSAGSGSSSTSTTSGGS